MKKYKLKAKRVELGIKQIDLANQIGITPQYLNLIEKNMVEPRRDLMIKIAKELNESVMTLFFNEKK